MPDNCSRAESYDPTCLLNSPAKIDVIAGFMIFGIEAADAFKRPTIECHVTAGNMFGDRVGKQDVAGAARRGCDTRLDPILGWWRDVWPPYPCIIAAHESAD